MGFVLVVGQMLHRPVGLAVRDGRFGRGWDDGGRYGSGRPWCWNAHQSNQTSYLCHEHLDLLRLEVARHDARHEVWVSEAPLNEAGGLRTGAEEDEDYLGHAAMGGHAPKQKKRKVAPVKAHKF